MDASLVKKLKDMTNAGLMDCKKALEETNGNIDDAIAYLREKGISKAAKKADRIAVEGSSNVLIKDNEAVIYEVNCETDFVAANAKFKDLMNTIGETLLNNNAKTLEEALKLPVGEETLNDVIINTTATMGEKIDLRRFERVSKSDSEVFGSYIHMGGKMSALIVLDGGKEEVAKDIAMHATAMSPSYIRREDVPASEVERETEILKQQSINEGKSAEIAEKMVKGRINKFYKDICIEEQEFVKNPDVTVGEYVKNANGKIVKMIRFAVGEGMEKKEENFVDEVMKQIKG